MHALRNKTAIFLATLAAATTLAGCSHKQDNAPVTSNTTPQQQQAIQQNAAAQSAGAKSAPQMGTVPPGK